MFITHSDRANFHIKIDNIPIFMLKYGGIIEKSPAYVYNKIMYSRKTR